MGAEGMEAVGTSRRRERFRFRCFVTLSSVQTTLPTKQAVMNIELVVNTGWMYQ